MTRAIQDQTSSISIVEWLADLDRLASSVYRVGFKKQALQLRQFQHTFLTTLASQSKNGSELELRLACCLHNLAVLQSGEEDYVTALSLSAKAEGIFRRLGEPYRLFLAGCITGRSLCLFKLGKLIEAEETLKEALHLYRQLASNDPSKCGFFMASALVQQTNIFLSLRQYQKVLDSCRDATEWLSRSSPRYKNDLPYEYTFTQWNAACAYNELGEFEMADKYGQDAVNVLNRLISERPLFYAKYSESTTFSNWFLNRGRPQDALHVLEESLSICCSVQALSLVRQRFADVLYQKAKILHSGGDFGDALKTVSHVIDVYRQLLEEDETDSKSHIALLSAFSLRSSCLASLGHQSDTVQTIDAFFDTLRSSLIKINFDESMIKSIFQLLISQDTILKSLRNTDAVDRLRDYKKALAYIGEGILVYRQRVLEGECQHTNLAHLLDLRHRLSFEMSKIDEAFFYIQEAVGLCYHVVTRYGEEKNRVNLIRVLYYQARCLKTMHREGDALESLFNVLQYIQTCNFSQQVGQQTLQIMHRYFGAPS